MLTLERTRDGARDAVGRVVDGHEQVDIHVFDPHTAAIYGPCRLHACDVDIPDLRAGATLVLAALSAEGTSRISGTEHVARGYEDLVGKLSRVGARIMEEHSSCPSPSSS